MKGKKKKEILCRFCSGRYTDMDGAMSGSLWRDGPNGTRVSSLISYCYIYPLGAFEEIEHCEDCKRMLAAFRKENPDADMDMAVEAMHHVMAWRI